MSARSCQLCGKPLSRIWVGSDGDFCSREHRNQFRLRQGMGRLQEANKVANVMRRREHVKPLTTRHLAESSVSRRGFFQMKIVTAARPALASTRIPMQLPAVRIDGATQGFCSPAAAAAGHPLTPRMDITPLRFAARRRPRADVRRLTKLPVHIQQAAPRSFRNLAIPDARRREYDMARNTGRRVVPSRKPIHKPGVCLPGAVANRRGGKSPAARGKALRVSLACGIRLRKLDRSYPLMDPVLSGRLAWPERVYPPRVHLPQQASRREFPSAAIPMEGIFAPLTKDTALPKPQLARRAVELKPPSPVAATAISTRAAERFPTSIEGLVLPRPVLRHWKPGRADALSHISVRPSPIKGRGQSKHALAPFVPQDVPCGPAFHVGQNGSKD